MVISVVGPARVDLASATERKARQYCRRATLHQRPQVRAIVGGSEQFSKTDWSDRPASIAWGNSEAGMNASPLLVAAHLSKMAPAC